MAYPQGRVSQLRRSTTQARRTRAVFDDGMPWSCVGGDVIPWGDAEASKHDDQVSIFLRCISAMKGTVKVKASFRIRIPSSGTCSSGTKKFVFDSGKELGWKDLANRSQVLNDQSGFLVDGNLTVEVDIQVAQDKLPTWTPSIEVASAWMKLLDSATSETADVSFLVGGEGKEKEIHAHSLVLKVHAPDLAALAEEYDEAHANPYSRCRSRYLQPPSTLCVRWRDS